MDELDKLLEIDFLKEIKKEYETSSLIKEISYSEASETLTVIFKTDKQNKFIYQNVPKHVFNSLIEASEQSIGKAFHKLIREKYIFIKKQNKIQ